MVDKKGFLILIVVFTILSAIALYVSYEIDSSINSRKSVVCFDDKCVTAEIADTPQERATGLMFRNSLAQNSGMFFIFPEEKNYPFWMKDTLIPLDIIWISSNLEIVHIETATPCQSDPCPTYDPQAPALYVLEVNAGFAQENQISVGDTITLN